MAGFGHGLPLSRLYAKYWGGDVQAHPLTLYMTLTTTKCNMLQLIKYTCLDTLDEYVFTP